MAQVAKSPENDDFFKRVVTFTNKDRKVTKIEIGLVVRSSCELALQADARHVTRKPCKGLKRFL
jgi:hypothetical protein